MYKQIKSKNSFRTILQKSIQNIRLHPFLFILSFILKVLFIISIAILFTFYFQKILFYLVGAVQTMQSPDFDVSSLTKGGILSVQTAASLEKLDSVFGEVTNLSISFFLWFFLIWIILRTIEWFVLSKIINSSFSFVLFLKRFLAVTVVFAVLYGFLLSLFFYLFFKNLFLPIVLFSNAVLLVSFAVICVVLCFLLLTGYASCTEQNFFKSFLRILKTSQIYLFYLLFIFLTICFYFLGLHFFDNESLSTLVYFMILFLFYSVIWNFFEVFFFTASEN